MKIQIRAGTLAITDAERCHVEDRLTVTLARFSDRIAKVVVRLSGAEATAGGLEKRCQIDVEIRPQTLRVEDGDAELLTALNRASGRLERAVTRALDRDRQ